MKERLQVPGLQEAETRLDQIRAAVLDLVEVLAQGEGLGDFLVPLNEEPETAWLSDAVHEDMDAAA